ncbi:MAG: hypothetical protein KDA71_20655, partial [Planctomycetales bacterium]|nr:hypothetical protein [Planctomycetales bacterium]
KILRDLLQPLEEPMSPIDDKSFSPAAAREDEPIERAGTLSLRRFLAKTPGWLISTVVHLVLFLLLAICTFATVDDSAKVFVLGGVANEPVEELMELEPVMLDAEPVEMESISTEAIAVVDPGMANLGEMASFTPVADGGLSLDNFDSTTSEIGLMMGESGQGMTDFAKGAGGAEFFGVKAGGRKFIFIVDSSKSMNGGKFDAACEELMYAIRRLSNEQFFYIIFFDRDAARMTFLPNKEPEPRPVRATAANIRLAEQWVRTIELELRTDPFDAVEFAVKALPDAIYILTDGKFTDRGMTERWLKKNNKLEDPIDGIYPKVVIHTIGFWQPDGEPTLTAIAKEYGGTYRFVPRPKK